MNFLRSLLLENLGLKLVALLLALVVYVNVYLDRPAGLLVSFPVRIEDLADSLSLSGPLPAAVQADLRGSGKQLLRIRVTEPPVRISLEGVGPGRFERMITAEDLPLSEEMEIERLVGPRTLELQIEHKLTRMLPVAPRVEVAAGMAWGGQVSAEPESVEVTGPESEVVALDSVRLEPVRVAGRRDTLRADVSPEGLPDWCTARPTLVRLTIPVPR